MEPRTPRANNHKPSNAAGRRFWEKKQHMYPHQIEVEHMSAADLNPRLFAKEVSMDFLRVPFDGVAHWGFRYPQTLAKFKAMIGTHHKATVHGVVTGRFDKEGE